MTKQFFKISYVLCLLCLGPFNGSATDIQYDEKGLITKIDGKECSPNDKYNEYRKRAYMEIQHSLKKNNLEEVCTVQIIPLIPEHFKDLELVFKDDDVMTFYELGKVRPDYKSYVEKRGKAWVERVNNGQLSWWACYETINGVNGSFMGAVGCAYYPPESKENSNCVELAGLANPGYQGKGFASCILPNIIDFIWKEKPGASGIFAPIHPENKKSRGLVEKAEFVHLKEKDYFSESYQQPRYYYFLKNPKK